MVRGLAFNKPRDNTECSTPSRIKERRLPQPLLHIPDDVEVFAILPVGYPARPGGKGTKRRKSIGEVIHRERFNQPWA